MEHNTTNPQFEFYPPQKHCIIEGGHILFVETEYDPDSPNPLEEDEGLGQIRSFNPRHINYINLKKINTVVTENLDAVQLSYYEHDRCLWFVAGTRTPPGVEFQWDGVRFAGIWFPTEATIQEYEASQTDKTRQQWMIERAKEACKIYTAWLNGEVYAYSVHLFPIKKTERGQLYDRREDYRFDQPLFEEYAGDFIDFDQFEAEVNAAINRALSKIKP
jgi:hypothetical protein